jgi:hypothetical protein
MPAESTVTEALPAAAIKLAGTGALSWPELTKVVVRAVAFQRTTAPDTKALPFTVSVKTGPPAVAEFGLREAIAGAAAIVNGDPLVVIPAESTVIEAVPAAAISVAGTRAVSWLALTKVVVRGVPFQRAAASAAKALPFTVSVKAALPAVAEFGLREAIAGAAAMVSGDPLVVIPAESTVTEAVPAVAIRVAGTRAVSWLALTKVVVRGVPFQRAAASAAKALPFTVSVKAGPPAVAEFGLKDVIAGGALIKNGVPEDVMPNDRTVMAALPGLATRAAGTDAVSCVALTTVVKRGVTFHSTTARGANPLPLMVSVKAGAPAVAELGLSEVMAG